MIKIRFYLQLKKGLFSHAWDLVVRRQGSNPLHHPEEQVASAATRDAAACRALLAVKNGGRGKHQDVQAPEGLRLTLPPVNLRRGNIFKTAAVPNPHHTDGYCIPTLVRICNATKRWYFSIPAKLVQLPIDLSNALLKMQRDESLHVTFHGREPPRVRDRAALNLRKVSWRQLKDSVCNSL
jgi:hypothetical protein